MQKRATLKCNYGALSQPVSRQGTHPFVILKAESQGDISSLGDGKVSLGWHAQRHPLLGQ